MFSGWSQCLMTAKHEKVSFWFLIFDTKTRNFSNWRWFMASTKLSNSKVSKAVSSLFFFLLELVAVDSVVLAQGCSPSRNAAPAPTKEMWASRVPIILTLWHHGPLPWCNTHLYLSLSIFTTSRGSESGFSWYLSLYCVPSQLVSGRTEIDFSLGGGVCGGVCECGGERMILIWGEWEWQDDSKWQEKQSSISWGPAVTISKTGHLCGDYVVL